MGAVKDALLDCGEAGCVSATDEALIARLEAAVGRPLNLVTVAVESRVSDDDIEWPALPAEEARALAADTRVSAEDREELRWLLEVCGLDQPPTEEEAGPLETAQQCCECGKWGQPHWLVRDLGTGWRVCVDCG